MRKTGLHIAFVFIILLMALPAVQLNFHPFKEKPLNGAFNLAEKPQFNKVNWYSGEFQENSERYMKDHTGFRNFMVRVQNQVDFSLFRQANAEGAIIGKNKQLYEYDYIRSWLAIDYPGDSFVEEKLNRAKYVQEFLKREKNIDMIVLFEPGKASFYPEYIPSAYAEKKNGLSTYENYLAKAKEIGIDYIDLNEYFLQLKPESKYPLFPPGGTHWSVYGMRFAADSIIRLIENRRNIDLPEYYIDNTEISARPRDTDDDVIRTMNLLFPLWGVDLAYPIYSFDTVTPKYRPMVLVVADSYYWNIFNTRIPKHLFANEAFWYFNSLVYPENYYKPFHTADLDIRQEVEKQEVIFLMITERFLHKFDWTFIDKLYSLYTPAWLKDPVYDNINKIMQVDSWYGDIISKAEQKHISLEEALINEGKFLLYRDDTVNYLVNYGPEHFSRIISGDPGWMEYIREKALKKGISVEEMLKADALYIFQQNHPGLFELNQGSEAVEARLYSEPEVLDSLGREAAFYCWNPASFIRIKAWQIYQEEEIQKTCEVIRHDPTWLEHVKGKALDKGISLDEMIRLDAAYMWAQRLKKN
jgi:hypothetical protein